MAWTLQQECVRATRLDAELAHELPLCFLAEAVRRACWEVPRDWQAGDRSRLARCGSRQPYFLLNASSTCLSMALKFFCTNFSSSSVRILKGTRTTLFANFTLSQYWPYAMPPGILKKRRPTQAN